MSARPFSANATSIMRTDDFTKTQGPGWQTATLSGSAGETKKTTQWLFLSHIFSHVILQDRAALGASGSSSRANVWKRVMLATVTLIAAIWLIGMTVSFFGNRALQQQLHAAADGIVPLSSKEPSNASLDDLQRLEAARAQLAKLAEYHRAGAPWRLRWGLYSGDNVYGDFRTLYFDRFNRQLLNGVRVSLADSLRRLAPSAGPSDDWQRPYESLKAYLITTSKPEKSVRNFLSPVLLDRWVAGHQVDEPRLQLARAQFDFYADELPVENPFAFSEDLFVVSPGRKFLNSFAVGPQLVYQKLLARTNQTVQGFNFMQKYPEAKDLVIETKVIDGAFTGPGWKTMIDLIAHTDNHADADDWVLGAGAGSRPVQNISSQQVRELYEADYKKQWRDFLTAASVRHFAGPQDESRYLEKLSGNRSPLLALLCEVSQNTAEASPDIAVAFQPVQEVVAAKPAPQSCREQFKQPSNEPYANALLNVKFCLDNYLMMQPQPGVTPEQRQAKLGECAGLSLQAGNAARQIVKTNDPKWKVDTTVISLLLAPTAPPRNPQPAGGPMGVPQFCSALRTLGSKYPFDPNSHQVATLADLNGVFQPGTGTVSKFLDANKAVFEFQGSQYVQKSGKTSFTYLINQAASVQRSLYPGNSNQPQFQFTLKARAPEGESSEGVAIDGQDLKVTGTASSTKTFTWSGTPSGATLTLSGKTYGHYPGPWGAFQFFHEYTWMHTPTGFHLEWTLRGQSGQTVQLNGKSVVVEFELEAASVPLFERGFIAGLKCPAGAK
jgi:type VI secretion system protein ImpL